MRADDFQDAQRLLKAEQREQTLEHVKRKVNAARKWIKVGLSRIGMFRYPRERDFVVVTFEQNYRSNGLSNVMKKRQYWVKEDGRWKILYEGAG